MMGPTTFGEGRSSYDSPKEPSALSALDELRLVLEANELDDLERGAFFRREGLDQADLDQ